MRAGLHPSNHGVRTPMPEKQSNDAFLVWAREFQKVAHDLEERDRELRARLRIITEEKALLRERMRARLGL